MNFLRWLVDRLVNLEVEGKYNVPDKGGFVLATSHISRLDTPFLMLATHRKDVVGMVARDYEKAPFFGWFLNKLGVIWIAGIVMTSAFRQASAFLKKVGSLGWRRRARAQKTTN